MATSGLTENLEQQLECPVCLDQFKEPKVLPCLHIFCKMCLEGVLVKGKDGTWTIRCPECRKVVEVHCMHELCICADNLGLRQGAGYEGIPSISNSKRYDELHYLGSILESPGVCVTKKLHQFHSFIYQRISFNFLICTGFQW